MKTKTNTPRPVGRPSVALNFNFGNKGFTVKDVETRYAKSEKRGQADYRVGITQKIKRLIEAATPNEKGLVMAVVGKKVVGRGRPFMVYKYVTPTEAAALAAAQGEVTTPAGVETPVLSK